MKKLKRVANAIITDRKIQCCSAILVCQWYGPTVAVFAVIGAEMLYIAFDVFTMSKEELAKRQAEMIDSKP
jgi:hypothetical protein